MLESGANMKVLLLPKSLKQETPVALRPLKSCCKVSRVAENDPDSSNAIYRTAVLQCCRVAGLQRDDRGLTGVERLARTPPT